MNTRSTGNGRKLQACCYAKNEEYNNAEWKSLTEEMIKSVKKGIFAVLVEDK